MQDERNKYFNADAPLTLSEAADAVPKLRGKRLHNSTFWRWCRRGCKARNGAVVRLEHRRMGGQITTTLAALDRFFAELAEADLESFRERDTAKAGLDVAQLFLGHASAKTTEIYAAAPVIDTAPTPTAKPTQAGTRRAALEKAKAALAAEGI